MYSWESPEMMLYDLDISVRTYYRLKRAGIQTVADLCALTDDELRRIPNLGKKSYEEILEKLSENGLFLKENDL